MQFQGNGFNLEVPDDWQDRSIVSFVATVAPSEFAPNVVITKESVETKMSIEDYASRQFSVTQAEVQGLSIIRQRNIEIEGRPAVEIVQKIAAHGLNLQQLQTFILADDEVYIVTCTATAATFALRLPGFEKIAQSLQINHRW